MSLLHRRAKTFGQCQGAAVGLDALGRGHPQAFFQHRHVAAVRFGGFPGIDFRFAAGRFHDGAV